MATRKTNALATAAGNPAFEVGRLAGRAIKDPVRVGVVGLGRIGWAHHSKIVHEHNGFELVAVCDVVQERVTEALETAPECSGYKRLADMLKDRRLELVVVASPSKDHERMAVQSLKARKHVLVEKPAARNAAGIERMIAAARKNRMLLTMHHNYRLNNEYLVAREVIASGKIGEVFRIRRHVGGFKRRNDWQVLRKYGGGITANWGVHLVDQSLTIAGAPVRRVWGSIRQVFNPGDAEDDIKAVIETTNGVVIDVDMTSVDASVQPSWVILGNWGTFWIADGQAHVKYISPKRTRKLRVHDLPYALDRKYGVQQESDRLSWKEEVMDVRPAKRYDSFYDNLYKALRKGERLLIEPETTRAVYEAIAKMKRGSGF